MRVGFFGGTFDPPHLGHLAVAQAAKHSFTLDQVLFAPVGLQPLKQNSGFASYSDRFYMTQMMCEGSPGLRVSAIDAPRKDGRPNYTIDALTALQAQLPETARFAIVGADAFGALRRWHRPDDLLEIAEWIVVHRPGSPSGPWESLRLSDRQRARVHALPDLDVLVSATQVRLRLRAGEPCDDLLAPTVLRYIRERHLYGSPSKEG